MGNNLTEAEYKRLKQLGEWDTETLTKLLNYEMYPLVIPEDEIKCLPNFRDKEVFNIKNLLKARHFYAPYLGKVVNKMRLIGIETKERLSRIQKEEREAWLEKKKRELGEKYHTHYDRKINRRGKHRRNRKNYLMGKLKAGSIKPRERKELAELEQKIRPYKRKSLI